MSKSKPKFVSLSSVVFTSKSGNIRTNLYAIDDNGDLWKRTFMHWDEWIKDDCHYVNDVVEDCEYEGIEAFK